MGKSCPVTWVCILSFFTIHSFSVVICYEVWRPLSFVFMFVRILSCAQPGLGGVDSNMHFPYSLSRNSCPVLNVKFPWTVIKIAIKQERKMYVFCCWQFVHILFYIESYTWIIWWKRIVDSVTVSLKARVSVWHCNW